MAIAPMAIAPASPLAVAMRLVGTKEVSGPTSNPLVLAMLRALDKSVLTDETPWCAAFVGFICFMLGLPKGTLSARSWLLVGTPVGMDHATAGADIVVLQRGSGIQPGPAVLDAQGHVGFYISHSYTHVRLCSGNVNGAVTIDNFPLSRVLGVRRLAGA